MRSIAQQGNKEKNNKGVGDKKMMWQLSSYQARGSCWETKKLRRINEYFKEENKSTSLKEWKIHDIFENFFKYVKERKHT